MIISFALVIICYLAFAAVCFSVFPYPEEYAEGIFYRAWYNYYGINKILSSDSYLIFIFGKICTASIIGAVGGLFCLILSSMTMSKYVSLGIPVLVYFFFAQVAKPYKFSGNMSDLKFWFLDNSSRFSSMETWFTDYMGIPLWAAYAYFLPLSALTYLILISDYPKLDDSGTFILFRTGRYAWILGQIWFLICSAMTFISFLLISLMLTVMSRSFLINAWSLISKYTLKPESAALRPDFPFAIIDSSVINQSRPFEAVMHSVTLILMFMLSVGLIQIIFALIRKKIFGIFVNLSFIATGLVLWAVDIKIKWLFPIANSAFGWHYDGMYDKTIINIAYSYGYFFILCAALIICAFVIGKHCSFCIIGENG